MACAILEKISGLKPSSETIAPRLKLVTVPSFCFFTFISLDAICAVCHRFGLLLCCVEILKDLPVHSFNALIIPALRNCLPNFLVRPKAALLFWFFDNVRCGVLLLMAILVIYTYKNR